MIENVTSYWKYDKKWHRLVGIRTVRHDIFPGWTWRTILWTRGKWLKDTAPKTKSKRR
jgi:hypothetical protein